MSEDQLLAQFWKDVPNADIDERKWLEGPRVTLENLKDGTGIIQRVTSAQWFAAAAETKERPTHGGQKGPLIFPLGKYKGQLAVEVRENDPGYWAWAIRSVEWFAAKARAAGLVEDEEASEFA